MPRFAANLDYLFTDRPLLERIDAAAASGFKAIELQFPYDVPALQVKAAIERNKLTVLGINTPHGARDGEFGLAAMPGREQRIREASFATRARLRRDRSAAARCIASPARSRPSERPAAERTFIDNLKRAADLAAAKNITILIEPINARDRPNYFLNHVEHAADIIAKVGKPNVRVQFDFYHVQIVGGDLIHRLEKYHAGDRPSAMRRTCRRATSPTRGEINYPLRCSRRWMRSATKAGSAPNIGRAGAPRRAWAGAKATASSPRIKFPLTIKLLENPCFFALRYSRALLNCRHVRTRQENRPTA